jgi:FtsZ-interacting cell division protein ZipA
MRPVFLAQVGADANQVMAGWGIDPATREWLIILGAVALVALMALIWAVFLRKPHRRHHSHHHHHHRHHQSDEPAETQITTNEAQIPPPQEKHRRRKRHHRRHRSLNPTLAETGGLPPIRPEDPPEAQP